MKYYDGRGPLPPAGIHRKPWRGPSVTACRLRGSTALYRFFSGDGQLLYVGITQNPESRWQNHAAGAIWWHLQARVEVQWLLSRHEAEELERAVIATERPLFNFVHSRPDAGRKVARHLPERRRIA